MILKENIFAELKEIIDRDYVLLDLPNYRNIGDQLIYIGELDFLKKLPFNCLLSSSVTFFNNPIANQMILLQGGGNFGDLYPVHQNYRENIIIQYPNNKILIFPTSLHFDDERKMLKSFGYDPGGGE